MVTENKFNKQFIGIISGIILPTLVLLIFYKIKFSNYSLLIFFKETVKRGVYLQLLSFCVFPNLLLFFLFIWFNFLRSSRGVLFATLIYALLIFAFELLF